VDATRIGSMKEQALVSGLLPEERVAGSPTEMVELARYLNRTIRVTLCHIWCEGHASQAAAQSRTTSQCPALAEPTRRKWLCFSF